MDERNKDFLIAVLVCCGFFILGFCIAHLVSNYLYESYFDVEGYWNKNSTDEWISINIKGMDFDRAVEVCKHEVGHEIFAEVCENDWEKCANITRK